MISAFFMVLIAYILSGFDFSHPIFTFPKAPETESHRQEELTLAETVAEDAVLRLDPVEHQSLSVHL